MITGSLAPVGDHQVGRGNLVVQCFPRIGLTHQPRSQFRGTFLAAVDDGDVPKLFLDQIAECFLPHLAGPNHQDLLVIEPLEQLSGEVRYSNAGNTNALWLIVVSRATRLATRMAAWNTECVSGPVALPAMACS